LLDLVSNYGIKHIAKLEINEVSLEDYIVALLTISNELSGISLLNLSYKLRSIVRHDLNTLIIYLIKMHFKGLIKIDFSSKFCKVSITRLGKERFFEIANSLNLELIISSINKTLKW
jgi:hypothetical protein